MRNATRPFSPQKILTMNDNYFRNQPFQGSALNAGVVTRSRRELQTAVRAQHVRYDVKVGF